MNKSVIASLFYSWIPHLHYSDGCDLLDLVEDVRVCYYATLAERCESG